MSKSIVYTPRIRKSPFYEGTLKAGVTSFTVYNHMFMPTMYKSNEEDYKRMNIFHNAGAINSTSGLFYKADYMNKLLGLDQV